MQEPTVRAFVAVELSDEIRRLLERWQGELRAAMGRAETAVRWTRPESVHVTLQFLGDVPIDLVSRIGEAIRQGCVGAQPVKLAVGGIGAFPNSGRPRVLW